jgi:hypothetical protein
MFKKTASLSLLFVSLFLHACGVNKLQSAYQTVVEKYSEADFYLEMADDNSYLLVDTNPFNIDDYYSAVAIDIAEETVSALGMPSSTWQLMLSTRALDGTRTDTKNGVFASWTYHPDAGLRVLFTLE